MRALFGIAAVAALAWLAPSALADAPRSLGDVAPKDKDRKKPAKVYTEDDLRNPHRGTVSAPAAEGGTTATEEKKAQPGDKAAADKTGEKPKTEDELRAEREKDWHDRLDKAQSDVSRWTAEVSRIQSLLNDNTGQMYGPGRAAKADALDSAKKQLAAATQSVADLQEEGRRNRYR